MANERLFEISKLEMPLEGWYTRARDGPWWANSYAYSEEMKAGAKFPPIIVGAFEKRLIVVDGYHRIEAHKNLKIEYIKGFLKIYSSKADLLKDAVEANNHHGIRYTPQDKAHIARLLSENGLSDIEVSKLIGVHIDKLVNFTVRNIVNGQTIKAPLNKLVLAGKITQAEADEVNQSRISTMTIDDVLVQIISYLEFSAYPWGDAKYDAYAKRIVGLMTPHIQG